MSSEKIRVPKGTFDVLPVDSALREVVSAASTSIFERAGYGRIETPIFEDTALFSRGVGESTDIVQKEMFTFDDLGGRSMTLRPEGTASVCRSYVEHGMHKLAQPVKLWYRGPFFRYEAPQAGRFRQFNQIGAEALGSDSPLVDAESIMLLHDLLEELGVPGIELRLGSLGSLDARAVYRGELQTYLHANEGELSHDVRGRIDANPLRAFDAKDESTRAVMAEAPKLIDHLGDEDAAHFSEVRSLLSSAGISHTIDPTLVRGLDYYTRTVFAFTCDQLGAQSEVGGGGRYDGLVAELGGPATPGVGWAAGIERILLAMDAGEVSPRRDVFIAVESPDQAQRAMALVVELRHKGLTAELDLAGRSLKGQIKHADRVGARQTLVLGSDGSALLKQMSAGAQRQVEASRAVEEILSEIG